MSPLPQDLQNTIEWLIRIEEYQQARNLLMTAARSLSMDHPESTDFIAMMLYRTKHYQEALQYAEKTVSLSSNNLQAHFNLARCLNAIGRPDRAEIEMRKVLEKADSGWVDPILELALYICSQGRFDEAEQILVAEKRRLPGHHPHQSILQFNLAWHLIRHGNLKDGMEALRTGRKIKVWGAHNLSFPKPQLFHGLPIQDKKILLFGEAGAGDEIINARYAKLIKERGGSCLWVTGQKLGSVLSRVAGIDQVLDIEQISLADYDYWAPSMDLFSILNLDLETLPRSAYLTADPGYLAKWSSRISKTSKLKIGLRWQGNPHYEQDLHRSVPFSLFRKFFTLSNAEYYSLQRDSGVNEISEQDPIDDLSTDLKNWEDTVAAISLLDVVVTSCTSIAHLAGALGKKTFLLTPMIAYYVWASPGDQSIWYPDVKLFRQKKFHDWTLEVDEILAELEKLASLKK